MRITFSNKVVLTLAILIFYVVLTFVLYPHLFLNFSSKVPGGGQDDVSNILGIINFSIHSQPGDIYHLPVYYPHSFMLARTHPLFGVSVFFKVFQILGLDLIQSTNLYIIACFIIGAFGCYLLAGELSTHKVFPLLFSTLFIIHQKNTLFYVWIHFLSLFCIPFVFFFLIRFFRTKKRMYILAASVFAFFQILSSLYLGAQLWMFLLPSFLGFALLLKIISFKEIKPVLGYLAVTAVLIVVVFFPFNKITQSGLESTSDTASLIRVSDLFYYSKIIGKIFGGSFNEPLDININYYFPGFVFFLFVLFFVASYFDTDKMKKTFFIVLVTLTVLISSFLYIDLIILDALFLILMVLTLFSILKNWKKIDKWTKLFLMSLSFFPLLLIKFPHLSDVPSIYEIIRKWLPIEGMRAIDRTLFVSLPFLIAIAAKGSSRFFQSYKDYKKGAKILIATLILFLMVAENSRFDKQKKMMEDLPFHDPKIYEILPKSETQVLLEIPYYLDSQNSRYVLNWELHRNSLLNGSTSIGPQDYFPELLGIIRKRHNNFPIEPKLKQLINKYSVNHIIFHWDRLESYPREDIRQRVNQIQDFGKIIYSDSQHTILKTQEYIPIKNIMRTYASHHLKKKHIKIIFYETYTGEIRIYLNEQLIRTQNINSNTVLFSLKDKPLSVHGNQIKIVLQQPVHLKSFELID